MGRTEVKAQHELRQAEQSIEVRESARKDIMRSVCLGISTIHPEEEQRAEEERDIPGEVFVLNMVG